MRARHARHAHILLVSLGSTHGLRRADEQLRGALQRAGVDVALVRTRPPRAVRTLALTDLAWARASRDAVAKALEAPGGAPRAIIYSSVTAALLWPRRGAIRFDATSAGNRPGRHGLWQRPLERRRLGQADLLLPWSAPALAEAPAGARLAARAVVVPVAVEPSAPAEELAATSRDIAALTYAANPHKKGLDRVLAAWHAARRAREAGGLGSSRDELLVAGLDASALRRFDRGPLEGVRAVGTLAPQEYRALLRRTRVFVCAPRREDHGIAQLEALVDGCLLVTSPAPGPYAALPIARSLDSRLVDEDLARALRAALEKPPPDYPARARAALAELRADAVDRVVREQLVPRLLA